MKSMKILLVVLLVGCMAGGLFAKPAEVYLLPTEPGQPSKMVPVSDKASAWWLIQYDGGVSNYYLSGLLEGDTLGIFFIPPAACSLYEVHFCKYMWLDNGVYTYHGIVADVPDGVTMDDYGEYHSAASTPGPSAIGTIFAEGDFDFPFTGDWQWDTLDVPGHPDVDTNAFWAGTVIADSSHSTRIDAGVAPPYHAIGYKQAGAAPAANGPGWYSSHHLFWVRALVKVYENIGPVIEPEQLPGTYITDARRVNIYTEDFGPTAPGIGEIHLKYYVVETDTQEATVVQDSVNTDTPNFEYAWWHADIPGQAAGSVVDYWAEGVDNEGAPGKSKEYSYGVGGGRPDFGLVYAEGDVGWQVMGLHDAFAGLPWDTWYEGLGGIGDTTVTNYYMTGPGGKAISWLTFSGMSFCPWTFTQPFRDFMDGGGCLFVHGQDIPGGGYGLGYGEWVAPDSPHPLRDYLKAYGGTDDYITDDPFTMFVDNTDPLTLGMADELSVSCGSIYQSTWVGIFTDIDPDCVPLFFDAEGNILGYKYSTPGGFKVVVLYFPFDAITSTDDQDIFIANLTTWFGVGVEENPGEFVYNLPMVSPNPLSRPAAVNFSIQKTGHVSVRVYDVTGSLVSTLVNEELTAGTHALTIDTDSFASGVYFLKMDAGRFSGTRKFVVMK